MSSKSAIKIALGIIGIFLVLTAATAQTGSGKGRINGTVADETGQPLVGVKITIVFVQGQETIKETKTDKKGQWAAIGLGTGLWKVTAEFPGYITAWTEITIKQLGKNPAIPLTLKKEGAPSETSISTKDKASLELVERADMLYKEKKFDEAIAVYEEIKTKNPEIYLVDLSIGDCRRGKGETDKALEIYGQVLEKARADLKEGRNNEAQTLSRIGEAYVQKGDILKAQDYFRQSLEILPNDELLAYNVGEIFSNRQLDEAIQYFGVAAKIKPDWSEAHYKLGLSYLSKTEYENARRAFAKFLELEPDTERAASVKNILKTIDNIK